MKLIAWTCSLIALFSALTLSGAEFDLPGFLAQKLQAGEKNIIIPPGRYRVTPQNRQHLILKDLQDVTIIADNVEMICTETTRALSISNCKNVTIRGLTIDYDPLPYTQGRIVSLSEDKKVHDIELFDGYLPAEAARNSKYEIFNADTRTLATDDHYPERLEVIDNKRLRIINKRGNKNDPEKVGDLIVIGAEHAPSRSIPHAIVCSDNVHVRLESITLFASNSFGFFEENCDGSSYQNCRVDRRTPERDLVQRASPRLRSLNADAFHSKHAIKGPSYVNCVAKFMGDDAINICGDYHMIMSTSGAELRVIAKNKLNIAVDDPVELFTYEGMRLPDAKAVQIIKDGTVSEIERAFILKQHMDEGVQQKYLQHAYRITLDRNVDMPMGSLIASARRMGNGFLVSGCDFGFNRSRGILIKASNGKVIGNKLTDNWGHAILVSPEYWWLESGSSSNLEIRDNIISNCKDRAILIKAAGGNGKIAPSGAHRDITITGNTIAHSPAPGIEVTSTEILRVENNIFTYAQAQEQKNEPIKIINSSQVTQENNIVK